MAQANGPWKVEAYFHPEPITQIFINSDTTYNVVDDSGNTVAVALSDEIGKRLVECLAIPAVLREVLDALDSPVLEAKARAAISKATGGE